MSANKVTVNPTTKTVVVSSAGTVGPQGGTGASALVGTGAPSSGLGSVNDLFFDNQNYVLYKKTGSSTWTSQGSYSTGGSNTNSFSTISVSGQNNVVADSSTDTLTLTAGSNVTITTDDSNDAITIASTDTTANESITVSGDVTGSGTTSINATLANSGVSAGTYGSSSQIPSLTIDAKGRVTAVTTNSVSGGGGGSGSVTSVAVSGSDGLEVDSGSPVTSSGTIALGVNASALRTHINVEDGATGDQTNAEIRAAVEAATDSNVFTDADHTKLNGVAAGAEVNVQSDWNASSGDAQILNKPTVYYTSAIPNATASQTGLATSTQITKLDGLAQSDWNSSSGGSQILNKPTLSTVATSGSYNDLSNKPTIPSGDVVNDTSPQLGGNLDVNNQDIVTTSNGNIDLDPNGSGRLYLKEMLLKVQVSLFLTVKIILME